MVRDGHGFQGRKITAAVYRASQLDDKRLSRRFSHEHFGQQSCLPPVALLGEAVCSHHTSPKRLGGITQESFDFRIELLLLAERGRLVLPLPSLVVLVEQRVGPLPQVGGFER